jgi:hypothetical protein
MKMFDEDFLGDMSVLFPAAMEEDPFDWFAEEEDEDEEEEEEEW